MDILFFPARRYGKGWKEYNDLKYIERKNVVLKQLEEDCCGTVSSEKK